MTYFYFLHGMYSTGPANIPGSFRTSSQSWIHGSLYHYGKSTGNSQCNIYIRVIHFYLWFNVKPLSIHTVFLVYNISTLNLNIMKFIYDMCLLIITDYFESSLIQNSRLYTAHKFRNNYHIHTRLKNIYEFIELKTNSLKSSWKKDSLVIYNQHYELGITI